MNTNTATQTSATEQTYLPLAMRRRQPDKPEKVVHPQWNGTRIQEGQAYELGTDEYAVIVVVTSAGWLRDYGAWGFRVRRGAQTVVYDHEGRLLGPVLQSQKPENLIIARLVQDAPKGE